MNEIKAFEKPIKVSIGLENAAKLIII